MNNNVDKFVALIKEDPSLSEKFNSAVENYNGDQSIEDIFQNILLPLAKEYGCDFTLEDMQEYIHREEASVLELSSDEMDIVAGGGGGVGIGASACFIIGLGCASQGEIDMRDGSLTEMGVCGGIGIGFGAGACIVSGSTTG